MQLSFVTENKEKSQVLLKITIDKDEVKKEYSNILNKTKSEISIKGFRKGKVPVSILEAKFKKNMLAEATNKIIDEAYKDVYDKLEKKPLGFSTPKMEDFTLPELEKDYTFELIYETEPEITFGDFREIEINKQIIEVGQQDIDKELANYQKQFASIEAKETEISDGDIVLVEYTVYDGEQEIDQKDNEYVHIGKDYDQYKLGQDLVGLKSSQEKELNKKMGPDEIEKIANKELCFKIKVKEVKQEILPELDDDLAQKVDKNVKDLEELKSKVSENLNKMAEQSTKQKSIDEIIEQLLETFKGEIPQSMIEYQMDAFYNQLLSQVGGDEKRIETYLKMQNLNKESYRESMRDKALKMIKSSLMIKELVKKENIDADEEEIKDHLKNYSQQYNFNVDEIFETYKKSGNLDMFKNEVVNQKAFDFLYDNVKTSKTEKISLEEFQNQQNKEKAE